MSVWCVFLHSNRTKVTFGGPKYSTAENTKIEGIPSMENLYLYLHLSIKMESISIIRDLVITEFAVL